MDIHRISPGPCHALMIELGGLRREDVIAASTECATQMMKRITHRKPEKNWEEAAALKSEAYSIFS
jgi:hypothetical protein